ncbi:hypothetical protein BaRGS_00017808 [Batillaria attramentaria]|uniref:C2H2-type domain-containing protein n=1 Tax=Batillaria attramentaria TaxID=370345 RepID=A0ABD0KV30_9CAEN
MANYMGTHAADGGATDKDVGTMLLPQTSISEASDILSQQGSVGLSSPGGYMNRTSSGGSFVSQGTFEGQEGGGVGGVAGPLQSPAAVSRSNSVETSDTGSGGAALSISYIRQGDNYVCSLCGKIVASKAAITRHIQLTHEKKKPFECNICHRRFGYKNILLEHQNIHFGIKPYSCNLCDKRFAARSNLFQHRLLHMKPFHCEVCNKRFDRADQLQRHLKLHPTSNLLSCNLCHFQASNVEALNHHLKESHTLQTYNTRSRFGTQLDGDQRGQELPTQVPLSGAGMNISTAGMSAASLETEAMRKIDTICSQLANRNQGSPGAAFIKSEPTSPIVASSPQGSFPPISPSHSLSSPPFSAGGDAGPSYPPNVAAGNYRGGSGAVYAGELSQSSSSPAGVGGRDDVAMLSPQEPGGYSGDSPTSSAVATGSRAAAGQFLTPSRRAASVGSIPGIQSFSRQNRNGPPPFAPAFTARLPPTVCDRLPTPPAICPSFFSILQALIQRSQDIPELNVNISRPQDAARCQHAAQCGQRSG